MIRHIILREILDHLKSLRFLASFIMVAILFTGSAVLFIPEYSEQVDDYGHSRALMQKKISELAKQQTAIYRVFSFNYEGPWIFKRPNRQSFIAEGHDRDLPNAFQPSAFRVYGPSKQARSNMLLWRNEALDWSFIVGVVLSFLAFVFVYDAISGDRENGTLRLNFSNSVSRAALLIGKFLGAFICLGSIMIVGMLMNILIVVVAGGFGFTDVDFATVAIVMALSLLCLAAFLMMGLFISGITRESATSLVVGLLCWAVLVVIIPRSGGFVAKRMIALPTLSKARETAYEMESDARKHYEKKHPETANVGWSGHWSPGEALGPALEACDAWTASFDEYRNAMIRQVDAARSFTLFSPYSAYIMSLESLTGSGIVHYRRFFEQVRNYRLTMRRALLDVYPRPLNESGWNDTPNFRKSLEPLNPAAVPVFEEKRASLAASATAALPSVLILMLFITLFFAGAFVSFLQYDVR
jgi:ABC-type transport system involved in multi-copper enzyme maturation permease subunit